MIKHKSPISGVASYKSAFVATAGYDNQVILWDAKSHRSLARGQHDHLANSCVFSPCGRFLASASSDYSVRLWSIPSMRLHMIFNEALDDIEMVSFHPTEQILAACSRDHHIYIFNFNGQLLQKLKGHTADVISVTWTSDGSQLLTSSDDGSIKRWSPTTGETLETLDMGGMETDSVVVTPEGLVIAGNDAGEIVFEFAQSLRRHVLKAHKAGIKRLVYHAPSKRLVSLSYDRTFCIWHIGERIEPMCNGVFPASVWPRSCSFLGDNELVFATFGDQYALYDIETRTWDLDHVGETAGLNRVFIENGQRLTVGDAGIVRNGTLTIGAVGSLCNFVITFADHLYAGGQLGQIFDVRSEEPVFSFHSPLNCAVTTESKLFVGTYTGEILVFGVDHFRRLKFESAIPAHQNAIKGLAVSREFLFSVCASGDVAFHDLKTFAARRDLGGRHDRIANGCVFVKDDTFASVSRDLTLRLWSARGNQIIESPHLHSIKCVASDESGRYICTGAYDGHVAVYDTKTNEWLPKEKLTASGISSLAYDAIARHFVASSYDGRTYQIESVSI